MRRFISILAAGSFFLCPAAFAAVPDLYLCVTDAGYNGDSTTQAGCSDVLQIANTGFVDGTLPVERDIKIVKRMDSASLPLRIAMVNGTVLNEVKIRSFVTTTSPMEFQTIRLREARVVSATVTADTSSTIQTDSLAFTAARVEYVFHKLNSNGSLGQPITMCWDVANQTATRNSCP